MAEEITREDGLSPDLNEGSLKLTSGDLISTYFRHYPLCGCMNYERFQANAYAFAMIPTIKRLYKQGSKRFIEALQRHTSGVFNCATSTAPFIIGISCAMEEEYANSKEGEFDPSSIDSVKTALMGPLAGIGDSMFWGTLRTIGVGVGAPMAVAGNAVGVLLYFLINVIPSEIVRILGFRIGYKGGQSFLNRISSTGILERVTESARVLGLIVVGSMVCTMVRLSTPLKFALGEAAADGKQQFATVQSIFDSMLPSLLPLCVVLICYQCLKKKINSGWVMLGIFVVGILGKVIGIF
jgi:mannose/fructose/N-acetylgalactosamine-specific phosphotransferase system component IID